MVSIDKIMAYENGEMDMQDMIDMFQEMITDKSVWTLQGSYGRMAANLIKEGYCTLPAEMKVEYQPDHDEQRVLHFSSDK